MKVILVRKNKFVILMALLMVLVYVVLLYVALSERLFQAFNNDKFSQLIDQVFIVRDRAFIENDFKAMERLYNIPDPYGAWAYKYEIKRKRYLDKWSDKQGVKFTQIKSKIKVTQATEKEDDIAFNLICSTEYKYTYKNSPASTNLFRIVTYHYLVMTKNGDKWLITKEWYLDPFEYSLNEDKIKTESIENYILCGKPKAFYGLSEKRIRAVEYADRYCGASGDEKLGFMYNSKYKNYNGIGGDCTNFISQVLYEGGKFNKTDTWNYDEGGSSAWVGADSFKDYMAYSGRASLIAYGNYEKVYKETYNLEPGDVISYERKGRVEHTAVVTGTDSKGYILVNCHTVDSYRVPWDLGWNDRDIKFYVFRIHY